MIKIEGADKSFESCQDCVHSYDSTEICILRRCIHVFSELRECYEPKKELKPSAQPVDKDMNVPCTDTISRKAAIEAVCRMMHDCFGSGDEEMDAIAVTLNELPSVQPEPCGDTGILDRFSIYQIEWLRSHNDIEFMPDEEDLIVRFLNDTLHCFKLEHQEKVDTPTVDTPTCEDAVSRKAVYNVLDKMPVRGFKKDGETIHGLISLSQVNSAIINLPSVQPEMNLDEWCTDCKEYDHKRHCCPRWNRVIRQTLKDMKEEQPEIIHCKDCVKHNKGHGYYLDGTFIGIKDCCPLVEIRGMTQGHEFDYQYCAYAERRTDG